MAYSKLVQAFVTAWGDVKGFFADNQFENVGPDTFQNFSKANALLHDRGPNAVRSLHKRFRYVSRAQVLANGNEGEALEDLDYDTCCVGTQIVVQYYQPDPLVAATRDQLLVAVYDATFSNYVYSDGSFRDGDRIAPVRFVPAASAAAQYGYVRRDTVPASISDWKGSELSIWELNGVDEFATAKQAGGPWPAFTGVDDAYWKPAAPPVAPSNVQSRSVQLSGQAGSAAALLTASGVEPWMLYAVEGQPDPTDPAGLAGTWNRTGTVLTVYVAGLNASAFATDGWVEVGGVYKPVENINVGLGTYTIPYSKQAIDQLLATKQDKVSAWVSEYVFFQTYTLSRSRLNQYVILTTSYGLTTITLPPVTVADAGAVIELLQAAGASSGLVRLVDTTGALVALLQTAGALVSLRLVISGTTTRWVVVGRSNEALIPVALGAIRSLRDQGRLSPDTLYLVDDNQWGTVYVRALDVNRLAGLGDALNTTTGKIEAVKLDVDAGTYAAILAGGVTQAQLATVATTLPLTATRTADYTLQFADIGGLVPVNTTLDATLTIAPGLGLAAPGGGQPGQARVCYPLQTGSGKLSIAAGQGVSLVVAPGGGLRARGLGGRLILTWLDTNTVLVEGGIL